MANIEIVEFVLPSYWATAMVNADLDGFDDEEQEQFDAFCDMMDEEYDSWHCVEVKEYNGFMRWHDAAPYGVLACDTSTFIFHVTER